MLWNGGSLVIGGAPPIGAGIARSPGRPTDDDHGAAGEVLGVVGDLVDGVVGQRHPHAAVAIGVGDRAAASRSSFHTSGAIGLYAGSA